jgi:hypothetical protein
MDIVDGVLSYFGGIGGMYPFPSNQRSNFLSTRLPLMTHVSWKGNNLHRLLNLQGLHCNSHLLFHKRVEKL